MQNTSQTKFQLHLFRVLWVIFLFLLILGQLQRVQLKPRVALYVHDVLLAGWVIMVFFKISNKKKALTKIGKSLPAAHRFFLLFLAWGILSLIFNQLMSGFSPKPWLYLGRLCCYLLFALSLDLPFIKKQLTVKTNSHKIKLIPLGLIISGFIVAIIAWLQYLLMPDARHLASLGWDVHYFRLMGFYLDPNFTGLILTIIAVNLFRLQPTQLFSSQANQKQTQLTQQLFSGLVYLLLIASILFTYSRSSYLAFLGSLAMISVFQWLAEKKAEFFKLILLGILFLVCLPLLPRPGGEGVRLTRTSTIKSRVETNQTSLTAVRGLDLVWGNGLFTSSVNTKQNSQKPIHAHFPDNIFVFLLSTTGLVGILLFSLSLIAWLRALYQQDYYLFVILLAVLGHSFFNLSLHEPFVLLWLLTSLVVPSKVEKRVSELINLDI